ncbi:MAG: hypothetical protein ABSF67_00070 [Roseiarcus sp.]
MTRRRRERGDIEGRADPDMAPPPPMVELDPALVGRVTATPWVVPTPQLGDDPTPFLNAMQRALRNGREADEARARSRIVAAPRRSLRRVF